MFVVTKRAVSGLEKDRSGGACEYPVKVFADKAQAVEWIEADVRAFEAFLKERPDSAYRRVFDFGGKHGEEREGVWTPEVMPGFSAGDESAHSIPERRVWFSDVGEEDVPEGEDVVPYMREHARLWVDVAYGYYEVDCEKEMLERSAGVLPPHVSDDPRW